MFWHVTWNANFSNFIHFFSRMFFLMHCKYVDFGYECITYLMIFPSPHERSFRYVVYEGQRVQLTGLACFPCPFWWTITCERVAKIDARASVGARGNVTLTVSWKNKWLLSFLWSNKRNHCLILRYVKNILNFLIYANNILNFLLSFQNYTRL